MNERFRRDLAGVLDRWVSDDLVTAAQADRLRGYYALGDLDAQASSRFVMAILSFGAVLIGLGVISFVAANWEYIPPAVRVAVATALMVGCDYGGWRLWTGDRHQRWGTVLLLVGTFLLGADIALTAQWFQVGGSGGGLFLGWGLGALALAGAIRHPGVGAVGASVLLGAAMLDDVAPWLPWVYAGLVVPLAVTTASAPLLGLALVGAFLSAGYLVLEVGAVALTGTVLALALGALGASALAGAIPAWREAGRAAGGGQAHWGPTLTEVGDRLGTLVLAFALFTWSFQGTWSMAHRIGGSHITPWSAASASAFAALALVVAFVAAWRVRTARPGLAAAGLAAGGLAGLLVFSDVGDVARWLAFPENVLLAGFALWSAWRGLVEADRQAFWLGLVLLSSQVLMRFMEFETGLLLKSAAFIAWGVGLIAVGLWFERVMARRRTPQAAPAAKAA